MIKVHVRYNRVRFFCVLHRIKILKFGTLYTELRYNRFSFKWNLSVTTRVLHPLGVLAYRGWCCRPPGSRNPGSDTAPARSAWSRWSTCSWSAGWAPAASCTNGLTLNYISAIIRHINCTLPRESICKRTCLECGRNAYCG